eukprot:scaffold130292_cov50-Attheya_sp.AAC.3
MAEPTVLRLHDNQSFPDQLGYAVHQTVVQTMVHLKKDTVFMLKDVKSRSLNRFSTLFLPAGTLNQLLNRLSVVLKNFENLFVSSLV